MDKIGEDHPSNYEILEDYMNHLKLANRSENTLKTYIRILEPFLEDVRVPVRDLNSKDVLNWLQENGKYRRETTISTWMSALSSFFTFCMNEEYIEQVPMKGRWRPLIPKPIPRYLEKEAFAKVKLESEKAKLRNQVLFEFLSSSGCRITETLTMGRKDIDTKERTASVIGKGNKYRTVHFSERCAILLERHLKELPEMSTSIFLNQHGNRLSRQGAFKILRDMGKEAELEESISPHRLRHTFATRLLSKGAELSFISEELGHSQLSTTRIYARLPKEEMVRMYRKYMG